MTYVLFAGCNFKKNIPIELNIKATVLYPYRYIYIRNKYKIALKQLTYQIPGSNVKLIASTASNL